MNKKCSCSANTCRLEKSLFHPHLEFLQVIDDPTRLRILYFLRHKTHCVCEIFKSLNLPQNLVSHHLRVLREAGLIKATRDGKFVRYSLVSSLLQENLKDISLLFQTNDPL